MALGLDCTVLRDLFGTEETRAAVTSEAMVQGWLDAERALAEAQAEIGMIPAAAAERIAQECVVDRYDLDAVRAGIAESQHPLVPLIRMLVERCGEHGAWVHWGATTQDIIDTGLVLQLRAGLAPVRRDAERARAAAVGLARRYRDTPQAGRTHWQHAVPISFGLKAASWADELGRVVQRLDAAAGAAAIAQLGGAAGTLAAMGEQAAELRPAFARRLGLAEDAMPWHAARDRVVDLGHALTQLAGAADRIAQEVIRLQATEVAELSEPLTAGHVGSSTMPQKRNPMTSEYLVASAMLLRATVSVLPAAAAHASERDMARWGVEWLAVPQAVVLAGGVADKLAHVLEGLVVDEARMRENLDATRGQIMAEAVMMRLAERIGHETAHHLVMAACRRAATGGTSLADELLADASLGLDRAQVEALLDPAGYLGLSGAFVDAVAGSPEGAR